MIGRLRGEILAKQPPQLLLDVNGVGYELEAPMSTFYDLPGVGERVSLFTHLVVREDAHVLYGFSRDADRAMFRHLLRVSGVGAKIALAILSGMSADEFAHCIQCGDTNALIRIPGIGKRTAERLIVEMRDRVALPAGEATVGIPGGAPASTAAGPDGQAAADAVSALVALGYRAVDASRMVREVLQPAMASEELIRAALRNQASKG